MSDFSYIKDWRRIYEEHEYAISFLNREVKQGDIVITHHLPSELSIAPQYKRDTLNRFFCHDMTNFILDRKPSIWIHGHTHNSFDYTLGSTRIICNPAGYMGENRQFKFDLLVEI